MTFQARDDALENIFREYALKYFQIHADQRMRVFQFYIAISTALFGAGILMMRLEQSQAILVVSGLLTSFFSFIFWRLDCRIKGLIKNAENAIKFLDDSHGLQDFDGSPNPLKLFARDDFLVQLRKSPGVLRKLAPSSYGDCFNWVFAVVGMLGGFFAIVGFCEIVQSPTTLG